MIFRFFLIVSILLSSAVGFSHAGHDHDAVPEAATLGLADVAPRFYAISDAFESVMVAPMDPHETTETLLYIMRTNTGEPVADAEIMLEIISPDPAKLTVTPTDIPGVYSTEIAHREDKPQIINLEVVKDDDFDILSFNNVIIEHENHEDHDDDHGHDEAEPLFGKFDIAGIPDYLIWAAAVAILLILLANAFILLMLLFKRKPKDYSKLNGLVLAGFLSAFAAVSGMVSAHSGDDHSNASLVESAVAGGPVKQHFVDITTQFQADIRTTSVQEAELRESFKALGHVRVRPDRRAQISSPVDGRIANKGTPVPVEGTTVTKGQVLLVIEQIYSAADRVSLSNEKAQTQADLSAARQELAIAEREKQRAEKLVNVISKQEIERILADHKIAEDKVTAYKERLDVLIGSLDDDNQSVREVPILAPVSGVVSAAYATTGESVITEKVLFEIIDLDEVFVEAEIFEGDISKIRQAKLAQVTVQTYGDKSFTGTLQNVGQVIDDQKRTLKVLFNVKNPDHLLRGGMFADVSIEIGELNKTHLIPSSALFTENGVRLVYKKTAPETFMVTPVKIDGYRDGFAVISGGLATGERVAVSGLYQVRMSPLAGGAK